MREETHDRVQEMQDPERECERSESEPKSFKCRNQADALI